VGFNSDLGARLSEGPALPSAIYRAWRAIAPVGHHRSDVLAQSPALRNPTDWAWEVAHPRIQAWARIT
jgi:hypothetical protein